MSQNDNYSTNGVQPNAANEVSNKVALDREGIERKVVSIIEKYVQKEHKHKIALSAELGNDLKMDSLSQMELLMELDEVMETETDQEIAQNLKTVQNIIDYASEKAQNK
jgi:acyl carrier protein